MDGRVFAAACRRGPEAGGATGEEYAIVVAKDNPQLTAAINEAIAKLEADGTIEELKAKNLG